MAQSPQEIPVGFLSVLHHHQGVGRPQTRLNLRQRDRPLGRKVYLYPLAETKIEERERVRGVSTGERLIAKLYKGSMHALLSRIAEVLRIGCCWIRLALWLAVELVLFWLLLLDVLAVWLTRPSHVRLLIDSLFPENPEEGPWSWQTVWLELRVPSETLFLMVSEKTGSGFQWRPKRLITTDTATISVVVSVSEMVQL